MFRSSRLDPNGNYASGLLFAPKHSSRAIGMLLACALLLISASARAEPPYVYGTHFWREASNIDVFACKPAWILFFEDLSQYSSIDLNKYKDAIREGHTVIVRLNWQGGDGPPPSNEIDRFAGRCAWFADALRPYAHIYLFTNEVGFDAPSYMAARYAIHAVQPEAYWIPGAPSDAGAAVAAAGDFIDGMATHGQGSGDGACSDLDENTPSGMTKPVYITEFGGDPPNLPDLLRNTYEHMRNWNQTHAHQQEAALRFVYFEFYQEQTSLLYEPMQNADFETAALGYEARNSFANPFIAISNLAATPTGETSAAITWTTDIPSTGQVEYWKSGEQRQYLSAFVSALSTAHSITLTGLEAGGTYSYYVKCYASPHPLTLSDVQSFVQSAPGSGRITGYVKYVTGTPVPFARVTRVPGSQSAYTSETGYYELAGCPAGTYALTAAEPGIETGEASAVVASGGTTTCNFSVRGKSNLVVNPGFEVGSLSYWTSYGTAPGLITGTWSYGPTPPHAGGYFVGKQSNNNGSAVTGGLYQRISVTSGKAYRARVYSRVKRENCPWGELYNRFGVDRFGGTSPASANVTWSARDMPYTTANGTWQQYIVDFTAASTYATVFLDYYEWDGNGRKINCFDDAGLFGPDTAFTSVSSCAAAKALPDTTKIKLTGRIASSGDTHFSDRFYIQDPNRTDGLCVQASPWAVHAGDVVTVTGTLSTTAGERILTTAAYSATP